MAPPRPLFNQTLIALLFFAISTAPAIKADVVNYPENMIFRNIMADQDIGLGEVEAIAQDHDGFMWFGGRNGLLRYDAYEFKQIEIEKNTEDPASPISVSQTVDLFVDSSGQLWVATRWGLYVYDRERELLERLKDKSSEAINFNKGDFNRVLELPDKNILIATYDGLIKLDPNTMTTTRIQATGDDNGLLNDRINDMFLGKDGLVWIGVDGGVSAFDPKAGKFNNYVPFSENPDASKENSIQTIKADKNGHIWAGASKGLYRIDPLSNKIFRYLHDENNNRSISDDIHENIFLDSTGILWVGTDRGGLNYYNYDTDSFKSFKAQEGVNGSISSSITRRIFEDRNKDLWVGTYPSGINFHDRTSAAITVYKQDSNNPTSLKADMVTDIKEDAKGNFWVATDGGGPNYFNRSTGEFKNYLGTNGSPDKVASKKMLTGLIDTDGDVWFGTWDAGVFLFNPEKKAFDQLPLDTSKVGGNTTKNVLTDTAIWDIYEDKRGNIWFATHNVGIVQYNKTAKTFTYFSEDSTRTDSIIANLVWTVHEDNRGRFWVGTVKGLDLMDRDNGTFRHFVADARVEGTLSNDFITTIFDDNKGRLWVGTNNGLHMFNESTETFTVFNRNNSGFSDSGIRSIEQDSKGNLWLGTNNGIVVFNPETKEVKNYRRFNGAKIGGISTGGSLKTSAGEIVMGGPNGLRIYDTYQLQENLNEPPVVLTNFNIFTKPIAINGEDGLLSKSVNLSESLTLNHKQSMISFDFAALNFRDSEKNQYAYKLDGFDDDWRHVGTKRQALYTNLSAGKYTFRVKASNNDGLWNEHGTSINVHQLPPPWLTWWAKAIYALIIMAIVARFIHQQHRKRKAIEEQNRILEQRVSERTAELKTKNDDIQSMLSNMRQGLFTIDSDGTIHPEYSAHLEDIFEGNHFAGKDAFHFLFDNAKIGSNELNQVKEGMFAIIGEDEINFDFNRHTLVEEYERTINKIDKCLSLDWNPIVDAEGQVRKLMVSVRDVTLLKQMENEAASKKRELDIISQLLNLPAKKYRNFVTGANQFLKQNQKLIESTADKDDKVLSALFRNMHTIKGNCRTYGFTHLSDVVHEVETAYAELQKNTDSIWRQAPLLKDLKRVNNAIEEYEHVYYTVLGRSENEKTRNDNGFWLNESSITRMHHSIEKAIGVHPSLGEKGMLSELKMILDEGVSLSLKEALNDVVSSLPSMAEQLNKPKPTVVIMDNNIRIRKQIYEKFNDVFAHLLRNSLDHGIEGTDERIKAGKPESGRITVTSTRHNKLIQIRVADDGKGLNLSRLHKIGQTRGLWNTDDSVECVQLCDLLFQSGVSTKDAVSDISGRGVGMDAVREFVRSMGGDVFIDMEDNTLKKASEGNPEFAPMNLILQLPAKLFVLTDENMDVTASRSA